MMAILSVYFSANRATENIMIMGHRFQHVIAERVKLSLSKR